MKDLYALVPSSLEGNDEPSDREAQQGSRDDRPEDAGNGPPLATQGECRRIVPSAPGSPDHDLGLGRRHAECLAAKSFAPAGGMTIPVLPLMGLPALGPDELVLAGLAPDANQQIVGLGHEKSSKNKVLLT